MSTLNHIELLLRLVPVGADNYEEGTVIRADLNVNAAGLDLAWTQAEELGDELLPDRAEETLPLWEALYGIYRDRGLSTLQRQARLVAARRRLPDFRPATIEELVLEHSGVVGGVAEPRAFRTDDADSVTDDPYDVVDGAHVFFVLFARADAVAADVDRDEVTDVLDVIRPAHTVGIVQFDDFRTDDPFSLTDYDILGA